MADKVKHLHFALPDRLVLPTFGYRHGFNVPSSHPCSFLNAACSQAMYFDSLMTQSNWATTSSKLKTFVGMAANKTPAKAELEGLLIAYKREAA